MRIPYLGGRNRQYFIEPLRLKDADALSQLHEEDFVRPWSEEEFAVLLKQEPVFGYSALAEGNAKAGPLGFVLARLAADEAEILTVAVARGHRRLGIGRLLMDAVLRELHSQRAESLFLEVAETNAAAIALYRRLGFNEVGKRPDYYFVPGHGRTGALVMRRDFR